MGTMRPQVVLFGDSITEQSFRPGGWGAALADNYSRKADIFNRGYGGYNTRWAMLLLHHIFPLGLINPPVAATIFFGANDAALLGRTSEKQHVPVEDYKENLRKIVQHLKQCNPAMLVVLITPPPVDEDGRMEYARLFSSDFLNESVGQPDEREDGIIETLRNFNHQNNDIILRKCWPADSFRKSDGHNPLETDWDHYSQQSLYADKAMKEPERTNEVTGTYAKHCVELAEELGVLSINLWSKMQETEGWQNKFLSDGLHLTAEGNGVVSQEVIRIFNQVGLYASDMPYDFPHHSEIDGKNPEKAFQIQCSLNN